MGYAQFIGKMGERKEDNAEEIKEENDSIWAKALEAKVSCTLFLVQIACI